MKTIASLKGPDFLRACNRTKHAVADFLATTGAHKMWRELRAADLDLPEGATDAEKTAAYTKRGKEIVNAMLDKLLDEEAEATYELLCTMIVPEEGESEPDGFDLLAAAVELVCTPKVMDFFFKLAKLVPEIMGD